MSVVASRGLSSGRRAGRLWKTVSRELRGNPSLAAGFVIVIALVGSALLGPVFYDVNPNAVDLRTALQGISTEHPLGVDASGRDILARVLHGGRPSLLGPLVAIAIATAVGVVVGMYAAWRGGWVDGLIQRALEVVFAFPGILLAILLVATIGRGLVAPIAAMSVAFTPFIAQLVRNVTLTERNKAYVDAYRALGEPEVSVALRHVFPNIAPVVLAQATINFGYAVMALGSISYLGFGMQPPDPDWGRMIAEGQTAVLRGQNLPSLVPGAAMVIAVLGFSLLGEGIADTVARRGGGYAE